MSYSYDPRVDPSTALIDYNKGFLNISPEWKDLGGDGVTVAIVDTGLFLRHTDFDYGRVKARYNAVGDDSDVSDRSDSGHGTLMAGVIGAFSRSTTRGIVGVAPKTDFAIVKVCENDRSVDPGNVLKGLEWLVQNSAGLQPLLVNMSLAIPDPAGLSDDFNRAFSSLLSDGTPVFAAAQNDDLLTQGSIFFPASVPGIIGVGALSSESSIVAEGNYSAINKQVKYILPNQHYWSTKNKFVDPYASGPGCSFATAFVSGVACLATAYRKTMSEKPSLLQMLDGCSLGIGSSTFQNRLEVFKTS